MRFMAILLVAASLTVLPLCAAPAPQGGGNPQTVHVGGDIKPPLKTKNVPPVYPPVAKQARIEGSVIIEVTIGTDGKVKDTKVVRSVKILEDAAVTAMRGWEFKPTIVNGQPVQVIMTVPINFSLD